MSVQITTRPIALSKPDAAAALSMSTDSFERYVMADVRCIRRGRLRLFPVTELERWCDANAERNPYRPERSMTATIDTARALIRAAVTDHDTTCLEAEAEAADRHLDGAAIALALDDVAYAQRAVTEAVDELAHYLARPQRREQREQIRAAIRQLTAIRASLDTRGDAA